MTTTPPTDTATPFLRRQGLLLASMAIFATVVVWGLAAPAALDRFFGGALASITRNFGWLYLWVVLGLVLLALFLAASRYGDLKLGDEDDEPEFSVGAWFAMRFAAGMGIGLVFWGVAEPISHYLKPPPGIVAGTPEAAGAAMRYAFFHWGLHPGRSTASWAWRSGSSSSGARRPRWSARPPNRCPGAACGGCRRW